MTHVADVTDRGRMRMFYHGETVADLSREFIDSAGAKHYAKAAIGAVEDIDPFRREPEGATLREKMVSVLSDANVASQKGLVEMFDSTIGRSTARFRPRRRRSPSRSSPPPATPTRPA